jgi:predicted Zn-dependent protease
MAPRDPAVAHATMEAHFNDLAATLDGLLAAGEAYTARFAAETSDFVRMNRGKVRQPGSVTQGYLDLNLQWSLYHRADKAVKCAYSGLVWDPAAFAAHMAEATDELARIAQPAMRLAPGRYRAYLSPAAMEDIAQMLCWGGFSARDLATRQSPLARMRDAADAGLRLDPRVTIAEATATGVAPSFQDEGYVRPARVPLIDAGRLVGALVSPRTAREFGGEFPAANGANGWETPEALAMAGGTLPARDALAALDAGLWIGNLHYLNFSDRNACRMTGMTRFATFRVEGGKIVAPVDVLRFDDTLCRMLGANLEALTAETEFLLDSSTYRARSLSSMRLPGALLSEMTFTL